MKRRSGRLLLGAAWVAAVAGIARPDAAEGQTDYYNTDRGRPVAVEDAGATERYALEIKLAPLTLERSAGEYAWSAHPEIAYGVLPRTSIEVGLPLVYEEGEEGGSGLAGVELSVFHNLNTETRTLPAFAVRGSVDLPAGGRGPDAAVPTVALISTRTFGFGRVHLNAARTFRDDPGSHASPEWMAGAAVDRALPLNAALLIGSVHVEQPFGPEADLAWNVGGGARYQVSPYLAIDAGLGRRLTQGPAWYVTFGSALHLGVRPLIPLAREAGR